LEQGDAIGISRTGYRKRNCRNCEQQLPNHVKRS